MFNKITIWLAPNEVLRDMYGNKDKRQLVKENILNYTLMTPFESLNVPGKHGAEEAFDLTNNPSRQEEREERYGNYRSVSVGDLVDVDGKLFLCASFGWEELCLFK